MPAGLPTRASVAIFPSGFPVLKKNALPAAGTAAKATMDKKRQNLKRTLTSFIGLTRSIHRQRGQKQFSGATWLIRDLAPDPTKVAEEKASVMDS
jgi:hypothetical protein